MSTSNFDECCNNLSNLDNNQDSEPAMSEKIELESLHDFSKSPSHSRDVTVNSNSPSLTMTENFGESSSDPIKLDNKNSEPAMSERIEETELESPRDFSKNRSRSHDSYSQEKSSRKRKRSYSASRSPNRKVYCGRYRSRHPRERDGKRYGSDDRINSKPSRCLGVFGLSWDTRENDLHKIFSRYGEIEEIVVVRRFAFVYYENIEDAKLAKERCRGIRVNGKIIRIDYSRTKRSHGSDRSEYNSSGNSGHSRNGNYSRKSVSSRYYNHRRRS